MKRLTIILAAMAACLVSVCLLSAGAASAASFDCAKAVSPAEKAVCADPTLSRLDERLTKAYRQGVDELWLDQILEPRTPTARAYRGAQFAWLKARDVCGADTACLKRLYEHRLKMLTLTPDPARPHPLDRFIGRYKGEHAGRGGAIMALNDNEVLVTLISGEIGKDYCKYAGIGRSNGHGGLSLRSEKAPDGRLPLVMNMTPDGLEMADDPVTDKAFAVFCPPGGGIARWLTPLAPGEAR